jgi:hypothetical protein
MKKNIVTIIFLFSVIFVTLMFGQDVEGFSYNYNQTDPTGGSGTYFTKETNGVSVFSALGDFSNAIRDRINNYSTTTTKKINNVDTTIVTNGIKNNLETCLTDNPNDKKMCYDTHYKTQLQSIGNNIFTNGAGKNLVDAVNRNTMAPANGTLHPDDIRVSNVNHESKRKAISETNQSNRQIQLDLDRKMNEMLTDKSGIKLESATKQNSTMYVGILWTVSAATALYYIFIKI